MDYRNKGAHPLATSRKTWSLRITDSGYAEAPWTDYALAKPSGTAVIGDALPELLIWIVWN